MALHGTVTCDWSSGCVVEVEMRWLCPPCCSLINNEMTYTKTVLKMSLMTGNRKREVSHVFVGMDWWRQKHISHWDTKRFSTQCTVFWTMMMEMHHWHPFGCLCLTNGKSSTCSPFVVNNVEEGSPLSIKNDNDKNKKQKWNQHDDETKMTLSNTPNLAKAQCFWPAPMG